MKMFFNQFIENDKFVHELFVSFRSLIGYFFIDSQVFVDYFSVMVNELGCEFSDSLTRFK